MPRSCRWTPLGPIGLTTRFTDPGTRVTSGRVTAIAVHPTDPNVVYVGTAGGGVWKTVNHGRIWKPLLDRVDSLAVGAIAVDPSRPDRIFVGNGEGNDTVMAFNGVGLLLTEDGGASFRRIELPALRFTKIVVSPSGNRVFAATTEGVWQHRAEDDGAGTYAPSTWTSLTNRWVSDLVYDDVDDRLFAAVRGEGVYRRDAGGNLTPLGRTGDPATRLPDRTGLAFNARIALAWIPGTEHEVIFAAYAHFAAQAHRLYAIFRSDHSGDGWTPVVAPRTNPDKDLDGAFGDKQAYYNLAFGRNPARPTDLFLGINSIWRSQDGGTSFDPATGQAGDDDEDSSDVTADVHVDQHAIAFSPSGEIWLGNDGGVWLSSDGGTTWAHRNRGLAVMQFYSGAHHVDLAALAYAGSQDNGSQFHEGHPLWRASAGGDAADVAIDAVNRRAWVSTNHAAVEASEKLDERMEAFAVVKMEDESERFFTRFALAPSNPNRAYFGTGRADLVDTGILLETDADLEPWLFEVKEYRDEGKMIVALAVSPDPRLLYVADVRGSVYQIEYGSLNSAVTKLPALLPDPGPGAISDLAVSPRDPHRLYAVVGETAASDVRVTRRRVFRWTGATNSWKDVTSALVPITAGSMTIDPGVNAVHAVVVDPDPSVTDPSQERVYIGCDRGVFESRDGGDSWRALHDGLPLTPVYDLQFHEKERTLRAFTHGRGAWERAADVAPCTGPASTETDLYLRAHRYDARKTPLEASLLDPVRRDGRKVKSKTERRITLTWMDGPDLKVDREALEGEAKEATLAGFQKPASTVDYTPDGAPDCIGFEALTHRDPRRGAKARVHLQLHNRGPDAATTVTARVFFVSANEDESWPDLPADFWAVFPSGDPAAGSAWRPIGPAKTIAEIRPAEPEVVSWDWDIPKDLGDIVGILAVLTSADDPVFEGVSPSAMPLAVADLVRQNKRISFKKSDVISAAGTGIGHKILKVFEYVGIAVVAGAAVYGLYEGGKYVSKKL